MAYKAALNRISLVLFLSAAGILTTGIDACKDDFCVACESSVPTFTPTVTVTPTDEGDDEEDVTPTPTVTPTATGTATGTLTPTITTTVGTSSIKKAVQDGRTLLEGIPPSTAGLSDLTWLGTQKGGFVDTDNDGFSDDVEVKQKSNPKDPKSTPQLTTTLDSRVNTEDSDADGLIYSEEIVLGTDPNKADTDGDLLRDDMERTLGTNPVSIDSDGDGVTDGAEVARGGDPLKADW